MARRAISAYHFTRGRPLREQIYGAQGVRDVPNGGRVSRRARVRAIGKVVTPPVVVEAAQRDSRRIDST